MFADEERYLIIEFADVKDPEGVSRNGVFPEGFLAMNSLSFGF